MPQSYDRPWTIQVTYTAIDDKGKSFKARTVVQVNAPDIPSAYRRAEESKISGAKFGAIIPGHHFGYL